MRSEYRPGYKKPRSRIEEIRRHEEAEINLARRLGEIPPSPNRLKRLAHNFIKKLFIDTPPHNPVT